MPYLNPARWLAIASHLPRPWAALVCVICFSLLLLGLRGFRYYVAGALAGAGYWAGSLLAKLMVVDAWQVGLPVAIAVFVGAWFVHKKLTYLVVGAACACGVALFVTRGLEFFEFFWAAFALGALLGVLFAMFAPRFSAAVFCAAVGSAGLLATLGTVVAAAKGPFAAGAYARYPLQFWVAGTVLFLAGMVLQVALDHDTERAFILGGAS